MTHRLVWERDGADWPHRTASRFVDAAGLNWHVQRMGQGPALLLLHGTGASTHSWRDVMPLLAERHTVLAIDLPGHAFTATPDEPEAFALPAMARLIGVLLRVLQVEPVLIAGHSAGAALAARMSLDGHAAPRALVSVGGALLPWQGFAAMVFAPVARLLSSNSLMPRLFAWRAQDPGAVQRLIDGTGSRLDARGVAWYARLLRDPQHVAGALAMMAHWDLEPLAAQLPQLRPSLTLVTGVLDATVPAEQSRRVASQVAGARLIELPGLGHLAHEEEPGQIARIVLDEAA